MHKAEGLTMKRTTCASLRVLPCVLFLQVAAGCATVDQRVDLLYEPVVHAVGGSGDLFVAQEGGTSSPGENAPVQWILGGITDENGEQLANIVTDIPPKDLVVSAYTNELRAAGYSLLPEKALPAGVAKGIVFKHLAVNLSETSSTVKVDATCTVKVSAELWKNGSKMTTLSFETSYSDTAITERDQLARNTLKKALQNLMKQSVPEIIRMLE